MSWENWGGVWVSVLLMVAVAVVFARVELWARRRWGRPEERSRVRARARLGAPRLEMTEAEILAALRVGEAEPIWRAVLQLLNAQIEAAVEETTDVDNHLKPPLPTYYAGAVRHLEIFRDFLVTERERAMAMAEAEE